MAKRKFKLKNSLDLAKEEGKLEKVREVLFNGQQEGLPILILSKLVGLSEEDVLTIINESK